MADLVHELVADQALSRGDCTALLHKEETLTYHDLWAQSCTLAHTLLDRGLEAGDRVAVYLPKQIETAASLLGTSCAGGCFVPVNPILKPRQVGYILAHSQARILVTSSQRYRVLQEALEDCRDLQTVILVDEGEIPEVTGVAILRWSELGEARPRQGHRRIDTDMVGILYTSGSTGQPKGVVVSHRNMVAGARSVASYLGNHSDDRLLAVLPLSFDAGLSQLTTAFSVGASVVLMDYLLPRDVVRAVARYRVTGLTAVPPLWNQLARLDWPAEARDSLRYIASTGGAMPVATTKVLRQSLPGTSIFLMYGLTEAFRSTYLPPDQVDVRPTSMGKAIPNAEIIVVNESGTICAPGEPGELVHRGPLVSLGYWNDPAKTAERFRPLPGQNPNLPITEIAVWSGDQVVRDEEGYLYFVSRQDEMIKTSGYRVSPTEVEEVAYSSGVVAGAVALGIPHPMLGQGIVLVITAADSSADTDETRAQLLAYCQQELPNFMVPARIVVVDALPHNPNGKIDRKSLHATYDNTFEELPVE